MTSNSKAFHFRVRDSVGPKPMHGHLVSGRSIGTSLGVDRQAIAQQVDSRALGTWKWGGCGLAGKRAMKTERSECKDIVRVFFEVKRESGAKVSCGNACDAKHDWQGRNIAHYLTKGTRHSITPSTASSRLSSSSASSSASSSSWAPTAHLISGPAATNTRFDFIDPICTSKKPKSVRTKEASLCECGRPWNALQSKQIQSCLSKTQARLGQADSSLSIIFSAACRYQTILSSSPIVWPTRSSAKFGYVVEKGGRGKTAWKTMCFLQIDNCNFMKCNEMLINSNGAWTALTMFVKSDAAKY